MARYKHYDYTQMKLLPVSFKEQILAWPRVGPRAPGGPRMPFMLPSL
jgi:hypothetical protein